MEPVRLTNYTARAVVLKNGAPTGTGETRQYAAATHGEALKMLLEDERKRWMDETGDVDAWRVAQSGCGIIRDVFSPMPLAWYLFPGPNTR